MNRTKTSIRLSKNVGAVGLIAMVCALAGCGVVDDVAHGRAEVSAESPDALAKARGGAVEWLPADAAQIKLVTSTRADDTESILFRSESGPVGCATVERVSAPTMEISGAPDVYSIGEVELCGDWVVAHSDDVWYGWTPAAESETPETPQ
jgi:hypothetical protein